MSVQRSVVAILRQLEGSLAQLSTEQYNTKIEVLSGATLGQHVRHVVEMFSCLQEGYSTGFVNYEKRKRDFVLETSPGVAIQLMHQVITGFNINDKEIILEACFDEESVETQKIPTSYFREIAYNLEHAIHHMAMIKIGFREVSKVALPDNYGYASSTVNYRRQTKKTLK